MNYRLIGPVVGFVSIVVISIVLSYKQPPANSDIATYGSTDCASVAIVALVRKPPDITLWLNKLRDIGVVHFFLRVEDTIELKEFLIKQQDVTFEMGTSSKENNYESLQRRQISFVNNSIQMAASMDIDWIFHIDSDELLEGSFEFLDTLDPHYKCVKIENAEAIYSENQETCFSSKKFIRCSEKGAMCRSYVNGKAGARVISGVHLAGPHDFGYKGVVGGDDTYKVPFDELHVLHFDSCTFGSWIEKFYHLGKNGTDTPFQYYNDSIEQVKKAYETYKKYTHSVR